MRTWLPVIMLPLLTACLGPASDLYPEEKKQRTVPAYVISHGWHVGIAFESRYLRNRLPSHERLPEAEFYMIGWGDNRYYPADRFRLDRFLRAAFLPTGSVLHVVGIDGPVDSYFSNSQIVRVWLTEEGMSRMSDYIAGYFHKNDEGRIEHAADGLYSNSSFFEARGLYFFPRTSNRWTAKALRRSGFPITPFYALTSGNVIAQSRRHGETIRRR